MKKLETKGVDFLENSEKAMLFEQDIDCSAARLFDVLANIHLMSDWLQDYRGAYWLSDTRGGVGSLRKVQMKMVTVTERFVVWDPGKRIGFTMEQISLPIVDALGEDMQITELGENRCHLRWRIAYQPTSWAKVLDGPIRFVFGKMFADSLKKLTVLATAG